MPDASARSTQASLIPIASDMAPLSQGGVADVRSFGPMRVPEDKVLRLHAAFPQLFEANGALRRLDDFVWTPACMLPAPGETQRPPHPADPCVRVRDVILAEEFTTTLTSLDAERHILRVLLQPPLRLAKAVLNPVAFVFEHPVTQTAQASSDSGSQPDAAAHEAAARPFADEPAESDPRPRCLPLPHRPVELPRLLRQTLDPRQMNQIVLTILCHGLPMPTTLPGPARSLLDIGFRADLVLGVVNGYVLTLLLGLLGACVHVMREINRRLDDFTLTRGALSRFKARLILGAVAGPFVGLFYDAGPYTAGASGATAVVPEIAHHLTPLALAFVAGFSVEVLFALLDRITSIFREFAYGPQVNPASIGKPRDARL
jgi:hypothetical protein